MNEYKFSVSSDVSLGPNLRHLRKSQCPSFSQNQKHLKMNKVSLKSNKPVCIAYSSCVQCRDWSLLQGTSSALRVRITFDILCEIYLELFSFQKYLWYLLLSATYSTQVNTRCYINCRKTCYVLFCLNCSGKAQNCSKEYRDGGEVIFQL